MSRFDDCPHCGEVRSPVIYLGMPGKYCEACSLFTGPAARVADWFGFNGMLFFYRGWYLVALFWWLFGRRWR